MPIKECCRAGAKVNGYIPDPAFDASNKLHFRVGRMLKMQTTDSANLGCFGMVDLKYTATVNDRC